MIFAYSGARLMASQAPVDQDILGALPDALECVVERDVDGLFEVSLTYPAQGENAGALKPNNWLYLPCGGEKGMQYFRITQVGEDLSGLVTVHGCHLSYNSLAIVAAPFASHSSENYSAVPFFKWYQDLEAAVSQVDSGQMGGFAVIGYTDGMTLNAAAYTTPVTVKQAVLDAIRDVSGTYLDYTTFGFRIWQLPGTDMAPGFQIRYGRDMLGYNSSADATDLYTHVLPYIMQGDTMVSHGMDIYPIQGVPEEFSGVTLVKPINLGDYYTGIGEGVDDMMLQMIIDRWLYEHPWDPFPDEIAVEQIPQEGNTFELGSVGKLYYTPTGTVVTAHVVSMAYDVLAGRVTSIGVNRRQKDVTDTIAGLAAR